jgi:diaminopimelate epimerase
MSLAFHKMHGIGNDAMIVDGREAPVRLDADLVRRLGDRRRGVGFDQLILLERHPEADVRMRIWNPDGGEAGACGNATRCVARLLMDEQGGDRVTIMTGAGLLTAWRNGADWAVAMGPPGLAWHQVPLAGPRDTLHLDIDLGGLADPVAVSMGNPHAVFFVADAEAVDIGRLGPVLEHDPLFPERANIGICQVIDRGTLRLRVWERGAGLTPACGSGACAALVAAARRGLCEREAELRLDGGSLRIAWREDSVVMSGPAAYCYAGQVARELLEP